MEDDARSGLAGKANNGIDESAIGHTADEAGMDQGAEAEEDITEMDAAERAHQLMEEIRRRSDSEPVENPWAYKTDESETTASSDQDGQDPWSAQPAQAITEPAQSIVQPAPAIKVSLTDDPWAEEAAQEQERQRAAQAQQAAGYQYGQTDDPWQEGSAPTNQNPTSGLVGLGIASIVLSFFFNIVGLVLGIYASVKSGKLLKDYHPEVAARAKRARTLSTIGIILNALSLAMTMLISCVAVWAVISNGASDFTSGSTAEATGSAEDVYDETAELMDSITGADEAGIKAVDAYLYSWQDEELYPYSNDYIELSYEDAGMGAAAVLPKLMEGSAYRITNVVCYPSASSAYATVILYSRSYYDLLSNASSSFISRAYKENPDVLGDYDAAAALFAECVEDSLDGLPIYRQELILTFTTDSSGAWVLDEDENEYALSLIMWGSSSDYIVSGSVDDMLAEDVDCHDAGGWDSTYGNDSSSDEAIDEDEDGALLSEETGDATVGNVDAAGNGSHSSGSL